MLLGPLTVSFRSTARMLFLVSLVASISVTQARAESDRSNIVCREELSAGRRQELETKLRQITGVADLSFD